MLNKSMYQTGASKIVLAGVLSFFGFQHASAIILPKGKTPKDDAAILEAAHVGGLKIKSIVGQSLLLHNGKEKFATGVYLGFSKQTGNGFVLTSAHQFFSGKDNPKGIDTVLLHFGIDSLEDSLTKKADSSFRIYAEKVLVYHDPGAGQSATMPLEFNPAWVDLALLEFRVTPATKAILDKLGIVPAELSKQIDFSQPLLEGVMVGFGLTGTSGSAALGNSDKHRIHAGETFFSYRKGPESFEVAAPNEVLSGKEKKVEAGTGKTLDESHQIHWKILTEAKDCLAQWVQPDKAGIAAYVTPNADDSLGNYFQYTPNNDTQKWKIKADSTEFQVKQHPRQAGLGFVDSGGPLFYKDKDGSLLLAGIASGEYLSALISPTTGKKQEFIKIHWEAVQPYKAWIDAVRDKNFNSSWCLIVD